MGFRGINTVTWAYGSENPGAFTKGVSVICDSNRVYFSYSNSELYIYDIDSGAPPYLTTPPNILVLNASSAVQLNFLEIGEGEPFVPPAPVSSLRGVQRKDDFGLEYNLMNEIFWEAPSTYVLGFNIYKFGKKIGQVSNSSYVFTDHDIVRGTSTTYQVSSYNQTGQESSLVEIVIN